VVMGSQDKVRGATLGDVLLNRVCRRCEGTRNRKKSNNEVMKHEHDDGDE